jgi:cell wall-associated NlpC family hydrolase
MKRLMFKSSIIVLVVALLSLAATDVASANRRHRKHTPRKADSTVIKKETFLLENAITNVADTVVENLLSFSKQFLGTPYRYSGTSASGFDCSGFVGHLFKSKGVDLPRNSSAMAKVGEAVEKTDLQPGDLVFFKGRGRRSGVGHVGMVVQANDSGVYMVHSSTSRGVVVEDFTKSPYFRNRFIKAKRVVQNPSTIKN